MSDFAKDTNVPANDCISRQAAIDAFKKELSAKYNGREFAMGFVGAESILKDLPFAQPERKTGRWIPVSSFDAYGGDIETWESHGNPIAFYYCSECKEQAFLDESGDFILSRFCPDCGAKMEVET